MVYQQVGVTKLTEYGSGAIRGHRRLQASIALDKAAVAPGIGADIYCTAVIFTLTLSGRLSPEPSLTVKPNT